ncbi:MAG: acyl-CoA carboxylase epsilon subunit [Acidimicrobiia bacterium]
MATSPSRPVEVVGGGPATPEQVAAVTAALDVVLAEGPEPARPSPWRWAGREWGDQSADWRRHGLPTHPSRP